MRPRFRFRREALSLLLLAAAPGCRDPEPTIVYPVPEGASPRETEPGEPIKPPPHRKGSGLPAPPPVNPQELLRPH